MVVDWRSVYTDSTIDRLTDVDCQPLASCLINLIGICNCIDSLISLVRSFTELYSSDIDNTAPFENTTAMNQNKKVKIKKNAEQVDLERCNVVSVR